MHLSDLHLGKRVNEFSMLEDQRDILDKIVTLIDEEKPDAVVLAGDIYDKPVPPIEAVQLFDEFLCALADRNLHIFVISGNHDSAERLAFGGRLMSGQGVHVAPAYQGEVCPITLEDEYGKVHFYQLPFIKPVHIRHFYEDEQIDSYTDALECAISHMNLQTDERNVLITHQFVTGALRSDSEEISVGGTDRVDVSVFTDFDYVALGHIHGPQNISVAECAASAAGDMEQKLCKVRYCGTPLKYSFSEVKHKKSATIVELGKKGMISIRTLPLTPKHDWRELRGTYMELTAKENYAGTATDDYVHITLTDEEDIPDVIRKLRVIYPNLMKLDYDNKRMRGAGIIEEIEAVEEQSPLELFEHFFELQNNIEMTEEQHALVAKMMSEIWEDA